MKKLLLTLSAICFTIILAGQQSLPISNDFELYNGTNLSSEYPGWSEAQGQSSPVNGSSSWYASNELFDNAAGVSFLNGTSHREWIITPSFMATSRTKITFNAALTILFDEPTQGYFGHDDSVTVMVKTPAGNYKSAFTFDKNSELEAQMKPFEVQLGEYAGQEISIGFYATDGNQPTGYTAFHLDDIVIKNAIPTDVHFTRIETPNIHSCLTDQTPVSVSLKNDGLEPLAGIPVRVRLRGTNIENHWFFINDTLAPGSTEIFEVGNINMSEIGHYELTVQTEIAQDSFPQNNKSDTLQLEHKPIVPLPLEVMTFNDFYDSNLTDIYPNWREARGAGAPLVYKNTDWQGDDHPESRGASVYFTGVGTNDWLVGPTIIPGSDTYVTFDAAIYYEEFSTTMGTDDKLAVMVSTDCGTNWESVGNINHNIDMDTAYQPFMFSLADYAGLSVKIAIYATTGNTNDSQAYLFFIDNLTTRDIMETDIALQDVLAPIVSCGFSSSEELSIQMNNEGLTQIDEFTATYTLNSLSPVSETVTQTLEPGESYDHTFSETLDLAANTENSIFIEIEHPDDENTSNNALTFIPPLSSFDLSTEGAFFAGFEDDEDLSNWTIVNNNSDEQEWTVQTDPQYAYEGNNSYSYFSNGSSTPSDDWLFSPCFQLEAGKNYNIAFWYSNRAGAFPEKLRLNLCSSTSPDDVEQVIIDLGSIENNDFLQSTNTFSVSTSGAYYFAWEAYGPADQFGLYIDNIEVWQEFENDLKIEQVNIPRETNAGDCTLQTTESVLVTLVNIGTNAIAGFDINVKINNAATSIQNYSQTINPGDTAQFTMDQSILIQPGMYYDIHTWVDATDDNNPANDSLLTENFTLDDYSTSFENNDDNTNWTTQSVAGSSEWTIMNDATNARTGNNYYAIRTDGADGNTTNNDWLISGCHYLEAGTCYELTFWYRSRFSYENLTVMMGNSADASGMTTEIFDNPDFYSNDYMQAQILVSVETPGAYYFGFHTDGSTDQRYYVIIDDVKFHESETSPEVSFTPYVMENEVYFETEAQNITAFQWDFDDGGTSTLQSPTHTYQSSGTYNATLTATSLCGIIEQTEPVTINIDEITADFSYEITEASVDFTADVTNASNISWNFGDGNHAVGNIVSNTYQYAGDHDVTLTAYSSTGFAKAAKTVTTLVAIEKIEKSSFNVYPNPAKKRIFIAGNQDIRSIEIIGIDGKTLIRNKGKINTVHIGNLPAGTYILKISGEKNTEVRSLIINN